MIELNYHIRNLENGYIGLEFVRIIDKKNSIVVNSAESIIPLLPLNANQFDRITTLHLTNCNLLTFPSNFSFVNVTELNISHNKISDIPNWLTYSNLKLRVLNVSHNLLKSFQVAPKFCKYLHELDLSSNQLQEIPVWLYGSSCVELETLDLSLNPFDKRLSFLNGRCLKKLKRLQMNNCQFKKDYVRFLKQIPMLQKLSISNNNDNDFQNNIERISFSTFISVSNLTEMYLSGLGSSILLDEISLLTNLKKLDVSYNYLSWLPKEITKLTSLEILNANHNELIYIPTDIGNLEHLTELYISHNIIGVLPDSIYKLKLLLLLDCYNNDIVVNLATVLKEIPSLVRVDFEQNAFVTDNDSDYLAKRALLRQDGEKRHNGLKFGLENLSDDESEKSYISDDYQDNCQQILETVEDSEENWDCDDFDSDDYLVLPPFRFHLERKPSSLVLGDAVDADYFADSPDDKT